MNMKLWFRLYTLLSVMNIFSCYVSIFFYFILRLWWTNLFQDPRIIFQRVECEANDTYMKLVHCYGRPIARYLFDLNVTATLKTTITPRIHFVLNYRYNSYEKYMIDRWEDPCKYFNGTGDALLFELLYSNLRDLLSWRTCPLRNNERFTILSREFSADDYSIDPEFPAGKYRFDVHLTYGYTESSILSLQFYFTLSNHEVWKQIVNKRQN